MKRLIILVLVLGVAAFAFSQMRNKDDEFDIEA